MTAKTRTITAATLRYGQQITNSGLAVEGRIVSDVHEANDGYFCWVQVVFTDGTTWDLDGWDARVTVFA